MKLSFAAKRVLVVLFGLLLSFGLAGSAELLFRVAAAEPVREGILLLNAGGSGGSLFQPDENLGYSHRPGVDLRLISKKTDGRVIRVRYRTDAVGRRITPLARPPQGGRFLLFFGDSFTFGFGVQDHQTLPSSVGRLCPGYRPYNYGMNASGPQHMLARLENGIRAEIPEKEGKLVYLLLESHFRRLIGSMRQSHRKLQRKSPYYVLENGWVNRKGDFSSGRPLLTRIYDVLYQSRALRRLKVDLPPRLREPHLELAARILAESKRAFAGQFGSDEFYVVLYPGHSFPDSFKARLDRLGVRTLDYSGLKEFKKPEYHLSPQDHHPTPLAYRALARKIARDLRLGNASTIP